jgi:hypothetical protein
MDTHIQYYQRNSKQVAVKEREAAGVGTPGKRSNAEIQK